MDKEYKLYNEIIAFNSNYLRIFYSTPVIRYRQKQHLSEIGIKKMLLEILKSLFLKSFWKQVDSTTHNVNYYNKENGCKRYVPGDKVVVYSCIIGNYDNLIEPFYVDSNVDYLIFTDQDIPKHSSWKKVDVTDFPEYKYLSAKDLNRRIKILPHQYLKKYKFSIYVDGIIKLMTPIIPWITELGEFGLGVHFHNTRDCIYNEAKVIAKLGKATPDLLVSQINTYKQNGYPQNNGMYENTILIRNHSDIDTNNLSQLWWDEYYKYPTRDQLSLPYVIWKSGYDKRKLYPLGDNLNLNPRVIRSLRHN